MVTMLDYGDSASCCAGLLLSPLPIQIVEYSVLGQCLLVWGRVSRCHLGKCWGSGVCPTLAVFFCHTVVKELCRVGQIVADTGLPNYQLARYPVVSDLKVEAWEKYGRNYPFKHILEYIKFGFPLFI